MDTHCSYRLNSFETTYLALSYYNFSYAEKVLKCLFIYCVIVTDINKNDFVDVDF